MDQRVSLQLFYKNGFGIKNPMKVDMLLNKRNKTKETIPSATPGNHSSFKILRKLICY